MTIATFDSLLDRITTGDNLGVNEITELAATNDILSLGMLADVVRRRVHGAQVTYLRVETWGFDRTPGDAISPAAREIRITGVPETLDAAVSAVEAAKAVAGDRTVAGFTWPDVERLAANGSMPRHDAIAALHAAGLDALAGIPLDVVADVEGAIKELVGAGFGQLHLTIEKAPAGERTPLWLRAAALRRQYDQIQSINPLPAILHAFQPTTGYDDVKAVALARLAAPNVPSIQIDWLRYGPKLAQVALTFGADDLDNVTALDEAPDGRRRAPLEEVRRGIEAAGFLPMERDGHFRVMS
jgi:aminodeoxyfutalosine synthase